MAAKNYYVILGVSPDTSAEKLRSAYRHLAKKHHPDRAGVENADHFRDIAEAYETLSDPDKRRSYNRKLAEEKSLRRKKARPGPFAENIGGASQHKEFSRRGMSRMPGVATLLRGLSSSYAHFETRAGRPPDTVELDAYLTPDEACGGDRVEMDLDLELPRPCPECDGGRSFYAFACPACNGSGETTSPVRMRIDLPPGMEHGDRLRTSISSPRGNTLHVLIHIHIIADM